jgi:hypothetical protein
LICHQESSEWWRWICFGRHTLVGRWGSMIQAARSRIRVPMRWIFSIYLTFSAALQPFSRLSPWQKWVPAIFVGVKGGRRVRLTPLPPSVSRLSREDVGASMSHNPMGLHGVLEEYLFYLYTCKSDEKLNYSRKNCLRFGGVIMMQLLISS